MKLSNDARKARNEYQKKRRQENPDKAKQYNAEYQKKWRKENPEKVKKYNAEYWERKAAKNNSENIKKGYQQEQNSSMSALARAYHNKQQEKKNYVCVFCLKVFYPYPPIESIEYCSEECELLHSFKIPAAHVSN